MAKIRTAKQKAALRKAQLVSARKRKGKGKKRGVKSHLKKHGAKYAAIGVVAAGAASFYAYKSRSKKSKTANKKNKSTSKARVSTPKPSSRRGAPRSTSLKAVGYKFGYHANLAAHRASKTAASTPRRRGAPKSTSSRARGTAMSFSSGYASEQGRKQHAVQSRDYARHRIADKARRKRGLGGYIPSKAKHDRRRSKTARRRNPRI